MSRTLIVYDHMSATVHMRALLFHGLPPFLLLRLFAMRKKNKENHFATSARRAQGVGITGVA